MGRGRDEKNIWKSIRLDISIKMRYYYLPWLKIEAKYLIWQKNDIDTLNTCS